MSNLVDMDQLQEEYNEQQSSLNELDADIMAREITQCNKETSERNARYEAKYGSN